MLKYVPFCERNVKIGAGDCEIIGILEIINKYRNKRESVEEHSV